MRANRPEFSHWLRHSAVLAIFAGITVWWTWPLAGHLDSALPGSGGDNYSFVSEHVAPGLCVPESSGAAVSLGTFGHDELYQLDQE